MDESNKTPRERNDEEKGILVREDTEGGKVKILDVEETPKADPSNNKLPSPSFPRVPYPGSVDIMDGFEEEANERVFYQDGVDEFIHEVGDTENDLGDSMEELIGKEGNNNEKRPTPIGPKLV
ncbi:hypothetical protein LWI29_035863 [Acer saccharum]|uniref:Uncharacterized protein n=1 Tax=Acer saccharum TaxID=4024 RepID=A0AA39S4R4_ACESA|nr:hypothetical protein LWI29_035863 [Acer saccharum]